jgi:hypothetical protein
MRLRFWKPEGVPDAIHASGIVADGPYLRLVLGAAFVFALAVCDAVLDGDTITDCACFWPLFSV